MNPKLQALQCKHLTNVFLDLRIMALNCWGVPGSFGAYDKEVSIVSMIDNFINLR